MTTIPSPEISAFALSAREGRTPEPLDILGQEVLVKLASADTNGASAVFHLDVPPMSGPPLHRHSREDEWFHVLEGEITVEIDGSRTILHADDSAFASRGTAHTFQNFGSAARILVMVTPGASFQQFFEQLSSLNKGLAEPDLAGTQEIMERHGLELLGPPLS